MIIPSFDGAKAAQVLLHKSNSVGNLTEEVGTKQMCARKNTQTRHFSSNFMICLWRCELTMLSLLCSSVASTSASGVCSVTGALDEKVRATVGLHACRRGNSKTARRMIRYSCSMERPILQKRRGRRCVCGAAVRGGGGLRELERAERMLPQGLASRRLHGHPRTCARRCGVM